MKALTMYQPWATLIAMEIKTIETRCHARFKCLEGERIALHAGKKYDDFALVRLVENGFVDRKDIRKLTKDAVPFGAIVCTAYVAGFRELTAEDSKAACIDAVGRFGLFLEEITMMEPPIPALGKQGVWNWK